MNPAVSMPLPRWLPAALLLVAMLWLMRDTGTAMVEIWSRSETFTHAFLVPPIALWLAWRKRAELAACATAPAPVWLLPMALACLAWLLGHLAAVGVVTQFAFVTLIVLSVPALFGWPAARVLAFPLGFLYFAVPFGEFTQPTMMDWTADFTIAALRASGVPVYREGLSFVIPSGHWSVVEACSGVRYLIASFMVGTLFAYLNYRSLRRRLIFMGVSILVPIVANWLRAYMIVMIGHLSGNALAVGADHLIYGWVFFGIVIGLMFFIGARWSEPDVVPPAAAAAAAATAAAARVRPPHRAGWGMAAAAVLLIAGTQAWAWRLDHGDPAAAPVLTLPSPVSPWQGGDASPPWSPLFVNPSAQIQATYAAPPGVGQPVWLMLFYFRDQGRDRKLVTSVHSLAGDADQGWVVTQQEVFSPGEALPGALPGGAPPAFRAADLQQRALLGMTGGPQVRAWQVYWTGTGWTASDVQTKVTQALGRMAGQPDDGAVLLLATPAGADADATLGEFARLHLGAIDAALQRTRDTR